MSNNATPQLACARRHPEKNGSLCSLSSGLFFHLFTGKELEPGFPFIYLYGCASILRHGWSVSCLEKCLIKQIRRAKGARRRLVWKVISHSTWWGVTSILKGSNYSPMNSDGRGSHLLEMQPRKNTQSFVLGNDIFCKGCNAVHLGFGAETRYLEQLFYFISPTVVKRMFKTFLFALRKTKWELFIFSALWFSKISLCQGES